jgi:hypothetical protein
MALSARVQPIDRDVQLILSEDLSPKARSAILAEVAADMIDEAKETNRQALGVVPPYTVTVDGNQGASLTSVKPDGFIRADFQIVTEAIAWIYEQLQMHSPVLSGRYAKSHEIFADGVEIDNPNDPPPASTYTFANTVPYSRKIERGQSSQAPDGVYQAVATLAARRFGNVAKIRFTYTTILGNTSARDSRQPAITVTLA